jgi:hypothetical protein
MAKVMDKTGIKRPESSPASAAPAMTEKKEKAKGR